MIYFGRKLELSVIFLLKLITCWDVDSLVWCVKINISAFGNSKDSKQFKMFQLPVVFRNFTKADYFNGYSIPFEVLPTSIKLFLKYNTANQIT